MILGLILLGYLVGSIPIGYLVARAKGIDIFSIGSGNPGATNVKRALGTKWGLTVFVLDVLKGALPVLVARFFLPDPAHELTWACIGFCAVFGHTFSCFLKFKGGKGVSTILGAVLGTSPLVALSAFAVFLVLLALFRYVSLASVIAISTGPFWAWVYHDQPLMQVVYVLLPLLTIYRHRANIKRLFQGTEAKFSLKSKTEPTPVDETPASAT